MADISTQDSNKIINNKIMLSIIMPCYNVSQTLKRAFDSIIMQHVSFEYEIIVINDCSTDTTLSIIEKYKKKFNSLTIINNIKNVGNAKSYFIGISKASGKYFCVLDGDDFYTICNKLQRQIDFLEQDKYEEYTAVGHYSLTYFSDGMINISNDFGTFEYNYIDYLLGKARYCHTSSMIFRNIYCGNPPEYFQNDIFRGDTPRTFFSLFFTNKKIKILNFVGSVYFFSYEGIWSKLSESAQLDRHIKFLKEITNIVYSEYEKQIIKNKISDLLTKQHNLPRNHQAEFIHFDKDAILKKLEVCASKYAFYQKDFTFHHLYCSEYIDTLCASIGYVQLLEMGFSGESLPPQKNFFAAYTIVIPEIRLHQGGIFDELNEYVEAIGPHPITILVAEMEAIPNEVLAHFSKYTYLTIICIPKTFPGRLKALFNCLIKSHPTKVFFYVGHTSTTINALTQSVLTENIHIFSYDHGFSLGLKNPNYKNFIVKRHVDYTLLQQIHNMNVIYIPSIVNSYSKKSSYVPFKGHSQIITATASARFYKLEQGYPFELFDLILASLKVNIKRQHIHYGPIPNKYKEKIKLFLSVNHIPMDRFINIEWAENLSQSLLDNCVDVFLTSFPIVSYKITLSVLGAGIPIISFKGRSRLTIIDFIYNGNLTYKNKTEFLDILQNIDPSLLTKHSNLALNYIHKCHNRDRIRSSLISCTNYSIPLKFFVFDKNIIDIELIEDLFSNMSLRIYAEEKEKMNDFEGSLRLIRQANKVNPDDLYCHGYLCHLLRKLGRFDEALFEAKHLSVEHPESAEGKRQLMYSLHACGRYTEARQAAFDALKLMPSLSDVVEYLKRIPSLIMRQAVMQKEQNGNLESAITLTQKAINEFPQDLYFHSYLCHLLRKSGLLNDALVHAEHLATEHPESTEGERQRMYALDACNRQQEALEVAKKLLMRDPTLQDVAEYISTHSRT